MTLEEFPKKNLFRISKVSCKPFKMHLFMGYSEIYASQTPQTYEEKLKNPR